MVTFGIQRYLNGYMETRKMTQEISVRNFCKFGETTHEFILVCCCAAVGTSNKMIMSPEVLAIESPPSPQHLIPAMTSRTDTRNMSAESSFGGTWTFYTNN